MASITVGRIAKVQSDLTEVVVRTSGRSTLPAQEQDRLLEQSCAEACELLGDWLGSAWWGELESDGLLVECVASREDFEKLLDPMFRDALVRVAEHGVTASPDLVDKARMAVADLSRRHRKMSQSELFAIAVERVTNLQVEVCRLADAFRSGSQDDRQRRGARSALTRAGNVLRQFALTMMMGHNVGQWARSILVTGIALDAQPGTSISPPSAGPAIR